jgi:Baseplate J-like protein
MSCSCGCCAGIARVTPVVVYNRAGLPAIAYRVGTHAAFLETMLARLSAVELPGLEGLRTRDGSDPSIALLDAWATAADVLAFYQERIANEGFLRTAVERRSIVELARLVGYRLRPGVASTVYLAYTLEEGYEASIPAGSRVQSLPGPGEQPQTFETSDDLVARAGWNALKPRTLEPQFIEMDDAATVKGIYLQGTRTGLRPNDLITFRGSGPIPRFVAGVEPDIAANRTWVQLQTPPPGAVPPAAAAAPPGVPQLVTELKRQIARVLVDLPEPSVIAARSAARLKTLAAALTPQTSAAALEQMVGEEVRRLEAELTGMPLRRPGKVRDWVTGLHATLAGAQSEAARGASPSGHGAPPVAAAAQANGPTLLLGVLAGLAIRPASHPGAPEQLRRPPADVYRPGATIGTDLLGAFRPELDTRLLYDNWAETKVLAKGTEVQSLEAMRVKAAPFGHNAPPKAIRDETGRVLREEEWPLGEIVTTELVLGWVDEQCTLLIRVSRQGIVSERRFPEFNGGQVTIEDGDIGVNNDTASNQIKLVLVVDHNTTFGCTVKRIHPELFEVSSSQARARKVQLGKGQSVSYDMPEGSITYTVLSRAQLSVADVGTEALGIHVETYLPVPDRSLLALDAQYDGILPSTPIAITHDGGDPALYMVQSVATVSLQAFGISARVTQLKLDHDWLDEKDRSLRVLRGTTVFAQSEPLPPLAARPIVTYVGEGEPEARKRIELAELVDGLEAGRWLIVSGERVDLPGRRFSELVMLAGTSHGVAQVGSNGATIDLPGDAPHTTLELSDPLGFTYVRQTVTIYGNVVKATHGETRREVMGSGDAAKELQRFALRAAPLTFVSAATPSGVESTLEIRVNDIRWRERELLAGAGPTERVYSTSTDDEDKTSAEFGNGRHGARLPSGAENVRATYRTGLGKPANVKAGAITMLSTKPLGVKAVVNPLAATGGADRDDRDQARRRVPLALYALDRLVSVRDYEDFAHAFAGIGKASAVRFDRSPRPLVHLTIAGADDIPIATDSDLFRNLQRSLLDSGDPFQALKLATRRLKLILIVGGVRVLPDYAWELVKPNIRARLLDRFGFEARELGQPVYPSEVVTAIQTAPGVDYVDLDTLLGIPDMPDVTALVGELQQLGSRLSRIETVRARLARPGRGLNDPAPAELAILSPVVADTILLTEIRA